jgi:hypothetical protein
MRFHAPHTERIRRQRHRCLRLLVLAMLVSWSTKSKLRPKRFTEAFSVPPGWQTVPSFGGKQCRAAGKKIVGSGIGSFLFRVQCSVDGSVGTFTGSFASASADEGGPIDALPRKDSDDMEQTWRYIKKPLLRIGKNGATQAHGNSLRQLLDAHTAVKVKINHDGPFDRSLTNAFEVLRDYAVQAGSPSDLELLQIRPSEKTILFGLPGTADKIRRKEFPPPPPPPYSPRLSNEEGDSSQR